MSKQKITPRWILCLKGSGRVETPLLRPVKQKKKGKCDACFIFILFLMFCYFASAVVFLVQDCKDLTENEKKFRKSLIIVSILIFHNPVYIYGMYHWSDINQNYSEFARCIWIYFLLLMINAYLYVGFNC